MNNLLYLDFETASEVDLEVVGLANYATHPSTRVLMLAYAENEEPIKLWQPHLESLPDDLYAAIMDPFTKKLAWNAPFEIDIFEHVLDVKTPIEEWFDIQVQARYLSLPGGLDKVGDILKLATEDAKVGWQGGKTKEGTRLINKFCFPIDKGGEQTLFGISTPFFKDWNTDPTDWEAFCNYCRKDVIAERAIFNKMKSLIIPQSELDLWYLDQKINKFGLPTNRKFANNAYELARNSKDALLKIIKEKTGLENPNSNDQFLAWVKTQGYPFGSLRKEFVVSALNEAKETSQLTDLAREILLIRQESSKQSFSKLEKLRDYTSPDGRLRNQFLFFGAARTGRWSGSGVQVQNLPRPMKEVEKKYERALEIITAGDYRAAKTEFSSIIGMATSCIRSSFQASPNKRLVVCDYSAIENRVLGWLAGCETTLRVFLEGRDPYLDFASELYNIPYAELKARYDAGDKEAAFMRQMAKPAVLGAGYGLGGGELFENKWNDTVKTGMWGYAANLGVNMTKEEAHRSVNIFREKRPKIVRLWHDLEDAATTVLKQGGHVKVGPVVFDRKKMKNGQFILRTLLPSGRHLHYMNAKIVNRTLSGNRGSYEKPGICYDGIGHGVGAIDDKKNWGMVWTYGGKFTENDVQGISRDILGNGMINADKAGFDIFGHFHDEIGCESLIKSSLGIKELRECMIKPPTWGLDLPLDAAGYESQIYRKG